MIGRSAGEIWRAPVTDSDAGSAADALPGIDLDMPSGQHMNGLFRTVYDTGTAAHTFFFINCSLHAENSFQKRQEITPAAIHASYICRSTD